MSELSAIAADLRAQAARASTAAESEAASLIAHAERLEELEVERAAPADNDRLLTAQQLAERLQLPLQAVYRLAREGRIPSVRFGERSLRFRMAAIEALIRSRGAP